MLVKLAKTWAEIRGVLDKGTSLRRNFAKSPETFLKGIRGGGAIGGGFGALSGFRVAAAANRHDQRRTGGKHQVSYGKAVLVGSAIGGTAGAAMGGHFANQLVGSRRRFKAFREATDQDIERIWKKSRQDFEDEWAKFDKQRSSRSRWSDYTPPLSRDNPFVIKGFKTKKEAKAYYHDVARQHHPDVNPGNKEAENKFKQLQQYWDEYQGHFEKLSHIKKFAKLTTEEEAKVRENLNKPQIRGGSVLFGNLAHPMTVGGAIVGNAASSVVSDRVYKFKPGPTTFKEALGKNAIRGVGGVLGVGLGALAVQQYRKMKNQQ